MADSLSMGDRLALARRERERAASATARPIRLRDEELEEAKNGWGKKRKTKEKGRGKNAPREERSDRPVSARRLQERHHVLARGQQVRGRDPRFDDLSGALSMKAFDADYGFLAEERDREVTAARKEAREGGSEPGSEKRRQCVF